jgi:hypothetical protein
MMRFLAGSLGFLMAFCMLGWREVDFEPLAQFCGPQMNSHEFFLTGTNFLSVATEKPEISGISENFGRN